MNSQMRQTSTATQRILRALAKFHAIIDGNTVAQRVTLVSPQLQGTDFNVQFEAAWALLQAFAMAPIDHDDTNESDADLEALLALMPSFRTWMRYLELFPSGTEADEYRKERQAFLGRWYVHVHPNRSMLEQYASNSSIAAIRAHVAGPHYCAPCRKTIELARGTSNTNILAAHTPDEPALTIPIVAREQSLVVSCIDDAGFLRVFLEPATSAADSTAQFDVTVLCESGKVLHGVVEYPQHAIVGANFGQLGPQGIGDVIGLDIEDPPLV